jgi:RNA polymerase sigma factor (sigma-70 family)
MTGVDEALRERSRGVRPAIPRLLGDERLARMAADGDERAFAAIYRRYGQELHRYCTAILGNAEDAADALQNTMASAVRALPGERREIALKPWLYRVAHNEAISLLRQRRPGVELDPDRLTVPAADADAATIERLRQLVDDLGQLPDRQRSALVMRELSGLSFKEIAASLNCSAQGARQLVYETRLALREMAEGREVECDRVRRAISERDGRVLRGRRLRAHLRDCERCANFRTGIVDRREDLAQLAPALALPGAIGLMKGLAGGGGAAGGGGGAAGGTGLVLGGSVSAKSATAVVVAATIGAGGAQVTGVVDLPGLGDRSAGAEQQSVSPSAASAPNRPAERARTAPSQAGVPPVVGRQPDGAIERSHNGDARGRSGTPAGHSETPPGQTGTASGQTDGTPPGQTGTPPGQTDAPPGQAAPPEPTKPPPGETATPPGQAQVPAGQSDVPPGQVATPPGQLATPPEQATPPPAQTEPHPTPVSPPPKPEVSPGATTDAPVPPSAQSEQ